MIEPEIAFADLGDDMMLAESMLKYIINYVLENAQEAYESHKHRASVPGILPEMYWCAVSNARSS